MISEKPFTRQAFSELYAQNSKSIGNPKLTQDSRRQKNPVYD
jgi:hypothetical protein